MEVVRYKEKYLVSDKGDVFKENKKYTRKKKQATKTHAYVRNLVLSALFLALGIVLPLLAL